MKKWIVLIFVVLILLCGKFYIDYSNKQAAESLLLNNLMKQFAFMSFFMYRICLWMKKLQL